MGKTKLWSPFDSGEGGEVNEEDCRLSYFPVSVGLHCLVSFMLVIEGLNRTVISASTGSFGNTWSGREDEFPPIVLLLAGLAEVIFGMAGMIHTLHGLISPMTIFGTQLCLVIEFCFGMFTFTVWVITFPAYQAARDTNMIPTFDNTESDSVTVLGLLGGFAYCSSIQGSQVYFANNILSVLSGYVQSRFELKFTTSRLRDYSILYILGAVTQLAIGCYVHVREPPIFVASGPFILRYTEIAIAVGSYMTIVSIYSLLRALVPSIRGGKSGHRIFAYLVFFSWLLNLSLSILVQIALVAPPTTVSYAVNPITCLITSLHLMPFYLDYQVEYSLNQESMKML